jgi:histidyl-tRNA synthetase
MAKSENNTSAPIRPVPRLPKGFRDIGAAEIREQQAMLAKIRGVYERYGFEPLETPAIEYTDALGKFLPDQDRPNEGVFSFQDEDEQWLSLRYDLTAPLARFVAENFDKLPKPFRRYATGSVFRNEKPGPGRFRQFTQFDADTVGAESIAADAEMCMLAADTLEALGIPRGDYVIKVNNRKVLDGLMEIAGLSGDEQANRRLVVLRAFDKLDRLGADGVRALLGPGRKDDSGDFAPGAGLPPDKINLLLGFISPAEYIVDSNFEDVDFRNAILTRWQPIDTLNPHPDDKIEMIGGKQCSLAQKQLLQRWNDILLTSPIGLQGVAELSLMLDVMRGAGYGSKRIVVDPSVIRGLEYYTGPVFEAELTFQVKNEDGQTVRFGSVGGGGRYDDLVARFTGQKVPATGFSIGVSRLQAALASLGKKSSDTLGPVVVLVMDKGEVAAYQKITQTLRAAGIRAEMYLGSAGMKAQMKYADKRGSPLVVIQGSDERAKGEVTLKDLIEGAKAAAAIKDNKEWKEARPAQLAIPETDLVAKVREILARHKT